jgi:hypothetical protein
MRLIRCKKDPKFAIPVHSIDWVNMVEAAGGMYLIKIGTGGITHLMDCETKQAADDFYEEIIEALREL